jgi:hypothetical protein
MTKIEHFEPSVLLCFQNKPGSLTDSVKLGNTHKQMFIANETQRIFEAIALKTDRALAQKEERRNKRK